MERGGETKELKIAQGAAVFLEIIFFFPTQLFHLINRIIYLFISPSLYSTFYLRVFILSTPLDPSSRLL